MSPEVGVLDEEAFAEQLAEDPDEALALLADLTGATDPALRELARRLAGRLAVRLTSPTVAQRRGLGGRLRTRPWSDAAGEIDLDASLDVLVRLRSGQGASLDELAAPTWVPPAVAVCLLVDRSGSMGGERLATAALAAAVVAQRAPVDHSVVAFADEVLVLRSQGEASPVEPLVTDLLSLRGRGTTDLAAALHAAGTQLGRSTAGRRITVLLSDCRATAGGDPLPEASALDELVVMAPEADAVDAEALAAASGARFVTVAGPASLPACLARALAPG